MKAALRAVALAMRFGLAAIWLVAAGHKVLDLAQSVRAVQAFRLMPDLLAVPVGVGLPFIELSLGALFLAGVAIRRAALVSAVLDAIYIAGIAAAAIRGLRIDCGCFTPGGDLPPGVPTQYGADLIRDAIALAVTLIFLWPRAAALASRRAAVARS